MLIFQIKNITLRIETIYFLNNTIMRKIILFFAFSLSAFAPIFAQKTTDGTHHTWAKHNITVTLPKEFVVKKNLPTHFEVTTEGIRFIISTLKAKEIDIDAADILDLTEELVDHFHIDETGKIAEIQLPGFEAAYVLGVMDDAKVALLGFTDLDSNTSYYAKLIFEDEEKASAKVAVGVFKSIRRN